MSHDSVSIIPDIIVGGITASLGYITWSGAMETFKMAQSVATLLVSIGTLVYVLYGIRERHLSIKKKNRR